MTPSLLNRFLVVLLVLCFTEFAFGQCDAEFTMSNSPVCGNELVTFSANSVVLGNSYTWLIDNGLISLSGPQINYSFPPSPGGYSVNIELVVVDSNLQCRDSSLEMINILPSPDFEIAGDFDKCLPSNNSDTSFIANFSVSPVIGTYNWSFGDSNGKLDCPDEFVSHSYTDFGSYLLSVSQNIGTCTTTVSQQVDFYRRPSADMNIATGSTDLCEGGTLIVQNGTTGGVVFFTIDWGDGLFDTVYTTADLQHVFSFSDEEACKILEEDGAVEFDIELIAFAGPNCEHSNGSPVFVTPKPRPSFTTDDCICIDDMPVKFENTTCNLFGNDYSWSFAGLGNSTEIEPEFSFPAIGSYTIGLQATSTNNCGDNTFSRAIEIIGPPTAIASFDPSLQTNCGAVIIPFDNSSTGGCLSYEWRISPDTGSEFIDSTDKNSPEPVINFFEEGVYVVSMDAINNCDTDTWIDTITVAATPTISITPIPDSCNQSTFTPMVSIQDNGCPTTQCVWTFVGSSQLSSYIGCNPPELTFDIPGPASVSVEVTNCCGSTITRQDFNIQAPITSISAGPDLVYCINDPCDTLRGLPDGGEWQLNGMPQDSIFCPADLSAGTYELIYFFDLGLCSDSDTITITIHPFPQTNSFPGDMTVCQNDTIFKLVAMPLGWWSGPGVDSSGCFDPSSANTGSTGNELTYHFSDPITGCVGARTLIITVIGIDTIVLSNQTFCDADTICLKDELGVVEPLGVVGIWTGPGIIDPDNGKFVPVLAGYNNPDTTTYQFTYTTSTSPIDCKFSTTVDITIVPQQVVDAGPDLRSCNDDPCFSLTGFPAGGEWILNGVSISSLLCPSDFSSGTYQLAYQFTAGLCQTSDTMQLIIDGLPQTTSFPFDRTVCENDTIFKLTASPPGWWSGPGIDSSGCFDPALASISPNGNELIYHFTDSMTGCSNTGTLIIIVAGVTEIPLSARVFCNADTICLEKELAIEEVSGATGVWSGPNGIVDPDNGKFVPVLAGYNIPDTTTYQFIYHYTSPEGCESETIVDVTIIPKQLVDAGRDTIVCKPDGILQLTANLQNDGEWKGLNGTISSSGLINLLSYDEGTYHFFFVAFEGETCESRDTIAVQIIDLENAEAGTDQFVCETEGEITLTGFSAPSGSVAYWDGPGVVDSVNGVIDVQQLTADICYTFYYQAISTTFSRCDIRDSMLLCVEPLPSADFEINGGACVDDLMSFSPNSSNQQSLITYCWDFDDSNSIVCSDNPSHPFSQAGDYTIRLQVITFNPLNPSDTLCINESSQELHITAPPIIDFTATPDTGCADLEVMINNLSAGENLAFEWYLDDVLFSIDSDPGSITLTQGRSDTTYTLTLKTNNQCGGKERSIDILVNPQPISFFGVAVDDYCSGDTISMSNNSYGNPTIYEWYKDGVLISTDSTPPIIVHFTDSLVFTEICLITRNECEADTSCQNVRVSPTDVNAFFFTDTTQVCVGDSVCFTNLSTFGANVLYDFGDGNTTTNPNPCHRYTLPGTYKVIQWAFGCGRDSFVQAIIVHPLPEAGFEEVSVSCPGDTLFFTSTSVDAVDYEWDFGDGGSSSLMNPLHVYNSAGTYEVCLTVYSVNECEDIYCRVIEVAATPIAGFLVQDSICLGDAIRIINQSSNDVIDCFYQFGNGDVSGLCSPWYAYDSSGNYEIIQIVSNSAGCKDTARTTVFVRSVPIPDFSFTLRDSCHPSIVEFFNLSTNAEDYIWDFGDGNSSTASNPTHTYQFPDEYIITLTAIKDGICQRSKSTSINIFEQPIAQVIADTTAGCAPYSIQFTSGSSGQITSYFWDFGDGFVSFNQNPSHLFLTPDNYSVILRVSNEHCEDADTINVKIHEPLAASAELVHNLCFGDQFGSIDVAIERGTSPFNFAWSTGAETEDLFDLVAGDYSLTITDSNRCVWIDSFTIQQPEEISLDITDAMPATCFGDSDGLVCIDVNGGVPSYELLWENGETDNCLINVLAGEYALTITDENNCTLEESIEISQNPPVSIIDTFDHVSCFGVDDAFIHLNEVTGGASDQYTISLIGPNGEEGDRFFFDNLPAGDYQLFIQDEEGCTFEKDYRITQPDSLWVDITDDTLTIKLGRDTFFDIKHNASAPQFEWTPADDLSCTDCLFPTASPFRTTTYTLTITEENGCTVQDQVVVFIEIDKKVYIPNVFTPNGDGINDVFMIYADEQIVDTVLSFQVFDRWGELVYRNDEKFKPNDPEYGWDGFFKGEKMNPGVFTYWVEVLFIDGDVKLYKGDVTLLRGG